MAEDVALAYRLVEAIGVRDYDAIGRLLAPGARLRALVPHALREDECSEAVVARLRSWWDEIRDFELLESEVEEMADRLRVRYRIRASGGEDGPSLVEQTVYLTVEGDRIAVVNLVCSGFRPAPTA